MYPVKAHPALFMGPYGGSWDRSPFNGYKVVFVPFTDRRPSGMAEDVVTGFLQGYVAYGRPVGLAVDTRGGSLIADDTGNALRRVLTPLAPQLVQPRSRQPPIPPPSPKRQASQETRTSQVVS